MVLQAVGSVFICRVAGSPGPWMSDLVISQLSVTLGRDHDLRVGSGADWPRRSVNLRTWLTEASKSDGCCCLFGVGGIPRYSSTRVRSLAYISQMSSVHNNSSCVHIGPVWARGLCRISPPRFLAKRRMRRLNQASFVLLCFVLFAFSGLCLVFEVCLFLICLLSRIIQRVSTWMALYSLIVLMCR